MYIRNLHCELWLEQMLRTATTLPRGIGKTLLRAESHLPSTSIWHLTINWMWNNATDNPTSFSLNFIWNNNFITGGRSVSASRRVFSMGKVCSIGAWKSNLLSILAGRAHEPQRTACRKWSVPIVPQEPVFRGNQWNQHQVHLGKQYLSATTW